MYMYLCSLSISFGIPVLPVVNVTRACSTVSTSKGLSSSLALDGKLRSLTSMCMGMARRDGRTYCVEWGGGGEEGREDGWRKRGEGEKEDNRRGGKGGRKEGSMEVWRSWKEEVKQEREGERVER